MFDRRASYYTVLTPTYLRELLEAVGHATDGLKFAGGSFTVHSGSSLRQLIQIAHEHDVYVSTGGFIEHILTQARTDRRGSRNEGVGPYGMPAHLPLVAMPAPSCSQLRLMQVLPRAVCHAPFTGP